MPADNLTVAWTGRPEFADLGQSLRDFGIKLVGVPITEYVDLVISAAGSHIFGKKEIERATNGIANLHMAPLPEFRGRYSATHAILTGATEYGATMHYVDEGIDTGPIIAQLRFPICPTDTAGDLRRRAGIAGYCLMGAIVPQLVLAAREGRRLPSVPQDESKARYFDRHSLPAPIPGDPLMERALAC